MKTVHENLKTLLSKHFGSSSRIPDSISDFLNDINDDYFRFIGQQNRTAAEIRNQPLRNPFLDAVELSFDPVFIMTKNGLLSYISPAVERLTEFSREELMNNHLAVMFPKSEIDVAHEILSAAEKGRHIRGLKTRPGKKTAGIS
jgi:PAS domain-containing protein